ncbi:hypothetical protein BX616_000471 [Lobosporangium transversale]|uniref:Ligand-effect modulator 3 family n=1 Tax=Lobosporangium transversale TaxID=64571 RepID=A0A1Y2H2B9_9FUNG|nr:ligand-effect modulator 3 family [Lobosporangium transversale]KAF9907291.1 hypothetical protein BX616_000471 [Lobosporangium transversale]ORZ28719.1 ligand-effect modulator 3 family [Lobosporangium transversale]|eukprot:XP_021886392.1 ligand-effect modulator 3 family [Lobosporangium transversale]
MSSETKSRKPANTAFKQQRLKAWQPILTPKTVLPTFLLVGILFAPLGGLLLWASDTVAEVNIDYTQCDKVGPTFVQVPQDSYSVNFPGSSGDGVPPEYKSIPAVGSGNGETWQTRKCTIKFNLPVTLKKPVFVYYRLTNFYQNHRRYVKSLDAKQLSGAPRSVAELNGGSCEPLAIVKENGVDYPIYPCGLIANSIFNDTLGLFLYPSDSNTNNNKSYILTDTGISWSSDQKKYGPPGYTDLSMVRPPPNWAKYKKGYSAQTPPINPSEDEHFQVWMRTAGLPNFRKLYSKNEQDDLLSGTYTIDIDMNYNVTSYGGTKSLVISTVSFMGGRNPFLGIAYIVVGVLCVVLGLLFTARHLYKPRRLGDHTYLSWNQNAVSNQAMTNAATSATTTGASARY